MAKHEPESRHGDGAVPDLAELLTDHRSHLERWLTRHAAGLLRFESVDDLIQGVHVQALEARTRFEYRSAAEFVRWLEAVARQHVADRHAYWSAGKRAAGTLLRVTEQRSSAATARGVEPAANTAGPRTRAEKRDDLDLAAKALAMMLPRDRELLLSVAADETVATIGKRLGITEEAAGRARLRALDRFRRTFELLLKRSAD